MTSKAERLAARLRSERARLGLSQLQLCTAGGVSKSTQVAYESGQRVPDLLYLDGVTEVGVDAVLVVSGLPQKTFVAKNFDWHLLKEILSAVSEFEEEQQVSISSTKLADLIHLLYDEFSSDGVIAPERLARALRLVA